MSVLDTAYRPLDRLRVCDLEAVRLILSGSSVIDWARLGFTDESEAREFIEALEFDLDDPASRARSEAIKNAAIGYLRRNFEFPIPKPIANANVAELMVIASGKGHRQLCACTILKVMHIIHHLEARELLFMLPISDQDVFHMVEQKVYRVIGAMLADGLPILEFIGGRKNRDSLYSKLLSKRETHAAQIYDKLRFRIVTRSPEDIFPVMAHLTRRLFAFNYSVPGEATNTMFDFERYCRSHPALSAHLPNLQPIAPEDAQMAAENVFSASSYRVVHFVVDLPVRLPQDVLDVAPPAAWALGRVVFAQAEFQIIDRDTEQSNEMGEASHDGYKERQKQAVVRRLKLGAMGKSPPAPRAAAKKAAPAASPTEKAKPEKAKPDKAKPDKTRADETRADKKASRAKAKATSRRKRRGKR